MTTQWLNANNYRRYPFIEDEDMTSGAITIGGGVFLDFRLLSYTQAPTGVTLENVEIEAPGGPKIVTFTFKFTVSGDTFSFEVPENADTPYSAQLHDSSLYHITATIGSGIADLAGNAAGSYDMDNPPQLEPALLRFQPEHRVNSMEAVGDGQENLTGHVKFEEGYNCRVAVRDRTHVRIDAARGHGAGISCNRIDPDVVLCSESLLRINGLRAGDQGDFMLAAGDGVTVEPDPDNHRIIVRSTADEEEMEGCG